MAAAWPADPVRSSCFPSLARQSAGEALYVSRLGAPADLPGIDPRRKFDELKGRVPVRPPEDRELGDDHVDDIGAGQRQRAGLAELGAAVLRIMLHHDDDLFDP